MISSCCILQQASASALPAWHPVGILAQSDGKSGSAGNGGPHLWCGTADFVMLAAGVLGQHQPVLAHNDPVVPAADAAGAAA